MALREVLHRAKGRDVASLLNLTRSLHALALPPPINQTIDSPPPPPSLCLPEDALSSEAGVGSRFPGFAPGGGSMELMAVPKRKISRHKRGIRNGPKALKPIPVIVRCNNCGKVKLPHYYCCGGRREGAAES